MQNRYDTILSQLSEIVDEDLSAKHQSLEYPYPLCRSMVYRVLHNEGLTLTAIEKLCGKHHSTVLSGLRSLDGVLSNPLRREYWICDTFRTLLSKLQPPKLVKIKSERDIMEFAVSDAEFKVLKTIITRLCRKATE